MEKAIFLLHPYDHHIDGKHNVGTRLKQAIFNVRQSAAGEKKNLLKLVQLQNSLSLTNKHMHTTIQILYIKTFTSITRAGLESVFVLYLKDGWG